MEKTINEMASELNYPKKFTNGQLSVVENSFITQFYLLSQKTKEQEFKILKLEGVPEPEAYLQVYGSEMPTEEDPNGGIE